ncbi:MAG: MarR family transcriptional regulator [Planctomycetia bacterium]|nr:MarR family transcriptional regulator [Planctomycetia bacterium]
MDDSLILEQAHAMASMMLSLMRQLAVPDDSLAARLPLAQLKVCAVLSGGTRSMSSLGRELGVSLSAMTQIADRLELARLVRRIPDPTDRRVKCLELTPRGQRTMRRRQEARARRVVEILGRLSADERAGALATFETLLDACAATSDDTPAAEDIGSAPRVIL